MNYKFKIKLIIIMMVPFTIILNMIFKRYPAFVEKYYSNSINKVTRQILSLITGVFHFSIAEILVFFLLIMLIYLFIMLIISIRSKNFFNKLANFVSYISILYVLFMLLWGFNYNRLSFDKISGLKIEKSSKQQLYMLCKDLIIRANFLRGTVSEDSKGIMTIKGGYKDVFKRAEKGYEIAEKIHPYLGGKYGPPKRILLSEKMSYTGITGIYIPYTAEANVNINSTDFMLPSTAAHEMAHQRGFAREDEANFIAYLTCSMHLDRDFQYSGVMLALIYSMNALAENDIEAYKELKALYSEGVKKDLCYDAEFWAKYEGTTQDISNNINNTYLKSNGQKDGVQSYGRMVDLLIAEYNKVFPRQ
ncbi:DUF3810 domain-containing protein [Clostridium sp. SYSU_GA19001]|uniref:DUF3810 domain-containing protein n=1 Tax=Clostridium caldaquaticum TaxID=2940653 RepID=UPI0020775543|nr:DUF3810 domain-containing protein [Clostridium caldaquaticum]MCM8709627.1 DUF3810 domain-containing protein [Clostridium caldaquaticum]